MDSGLIIAIENFRIDHSNLLFLEKLDFNIIKLDKYVINDFEESMVVQGLIDLLSYMSTKKDTKIIACEILK